MGKHFLETFGFIRVVTLGTDTVFAASPSSMDGAGNLVTMTRRGPDRLRVSFRDERETVRVGDRMAIVAILHLGPLQWLTDSRRPDGTGYTEYYLLPVSDKATDRGQELTVEMVTREGYGATGDFSSY